MVYALASSQEMHSVAVCNPSTQANTVCTAQNTLTLNQPSGWWHTSGTQILDSLNKPVYLRGAADGRMVPTNFGTLAPSEFSNLNSWGFDFIRLGVSWANIEPNAPTTNTDGTLNHTWNQAYLSAIDSVVKQAATSHLKIVLDFHQVNWSPKFSGTGFPSWLFPTSGVTEGQAKCEFMTNTPEAGSPVAPQDGLITTEQMVASRYLTDPTVVGVDMFNEPQSCNYNGTQTYFVPTGGTPYDDFYQKDGSALHQTNANLLLIYEDDAYQSYLRQGFALKHALAVPNAVYSTHMYPDAWAVGNDGTTCQPATTTTGQQDYQAHLDQANAWQQPFYVGEFDGFHLAANTCTALPGASQDLLTMMADAKANNVNWSPWEYNRSAQSLIDSSGNPKQPLLSDLQTGLTSAASQSNSGSVTLCQTGSAAVNSWDSLAADAAVPSGTTVSVKLATATGTCGSITQQSAFSAPITITDTGSGGSAAHSLSGLGLTPSQTLVIEVDLSSTDSTATPTVNSMTVADTPQTNAAPSVPTNVAGTSTLNSINLTWSASSDDNDAPSAISYRIVKNNLVVAHPTGVTSYTDTGLTQKTSYTYTIAACDSQGLCSTPSSLLTVTTKSDTTPPSVPTNVTSSTTKTTASVKWTASTDDISPQSLLTYKVYRNAVFRATTNPGVTTFSDSSLKPGTKYVYTVSACDQAGNCSALSTGRTVSTVH
jgi:chitodextrinase